MTCDTFLEAFALIRWKSVDKFVHEVIVSRLSFLVTTIIRKS